MSDIEKTIEGLQKVSHYFKSMLKCGFDGDADIYTGHRESVKMAIELLKEQKGIIPYIDIDEAKCPVCKVKLTRQKLLGDNVLFEDFFDYCPHCGKPVLWGDLLSGNE